MNRPLLIALVYFLFGIVWIYFSDRIVFSIWGNDIPTLNSIQNIKGFLFVTISTVFIGLLVNVAYKNVTGAMRQLNNLIAGSHMAILRLSKEGHILDVHKNFEGISGYPKNEIKNTHISLLFPESDRDHCVQVLDTLWENKHGELPEVNMLHKSGGLIPVTLTGAVHKGFYKGPVLNILVNDLTHERKKEKERLRKLELFESIFENIPVLITIYDPELKDFRVNPEFEKQTGWTNEELPNVDIMKACFPDEKEKREVEKWMQKHNAGWKELELTTKDGKKRIWEWSNIKLKDDTVLGIGVDLSELKKKEAELLESTKLFETIFNTAEVGLCLADKEGYFKMANKALSKITGYPEEELNGERFTKVLPEEVHDYALNLTEEYFESNGTMDVPREWQIIDKKGEILNLQLRISLLNTGDEKLLVISFLDLTEESRKEKMIENSRHRLKIAQDLANLGYWERNLKTSELIWEDEVYNIWGVSKDGFDLDFNKFYQTIHPDDKKAFANAQMEALNGDDNLDFEHRIILPDSSIKWVHEMGSLVEGDNGSRYFKGAVQDITARKQAELRLRESEEYLKILTQNASDGIMACDINGKLLFKNQKVAEWVGELEPDLLHKNNAEKYGLFHISGARLLKNKELSLYIALHEGSVTNYEFIIRRKGLPDRMIESNGSALYNEDGEKIGAMVVMRDITLRLQQEELNTNAILKAIEEERVSIARELHDGLTQYLSIANMNLKNLVYDTPTIKEENNYKNALKYVSESIDMSRDLSHRIMPPAIIDFGLITALEDLIELMNYAGEINAVLEYNQDQRFDEEVELNLYRILQELLQNIQKHSKAKIANILFNFDGSQIYLEVKDDGVGFDINKKRERQSGIGLRTVRSRVLKLKGTMDIKSSSGKGTVVTIKVPI